MINYSPFEPEKLVEERPVSLDLPNISEDTECNYIVMFFIAGVFILALSDIIRK